MENNFYVYAHLDNSGNCRYIGKGSNNRAWCFLQRSKRWTTVFGGSMPNVKILEKNLTEEKAYERECFFISEYLKTGSDLINVTAGGDLKNGIWDERATTILSEMRQGDKHWSYGIPRPETTREKISATKQANPETSIARPWLGKKRDPDLIKKMVLASQHPESKIKRYAHRVGIKHTPEHRAKVSEKLKGRKLTEEQKLNISLAKKGRPNGLLGTKRPDEVRKKISESRLNSDAVKNSVAKIWATRTKNGTASGFTTSRAREVLCVELNKTFRCAKDAAIELKADPKNIQACCVGRKKSHMGLTWRYNAPTAT